MLQLNIASGVKMARLEAKSGSRKLQSCLARILYTQSKTVAVDQRLIKIAGARCPAESKMQAQEECMQLCENTESLHLFSKTLECIIDVENHDTLTKIVCVIC